MLAVAVCGALLATSPLSWSEDKVGVILVGETDYRAQSSEVEGLNGISLARFRLGARVQPLPWLQAVGVAEWAIDKPVLNDALVALSPLPSLRVLVGFTKTPLFASAKDVFEESLPIPEHSLVVRSFWPRRDLGVELQWTPWRLPVEAWVRLGNGGGSPLGNDNNHPSGDARVDLTLGREHRARGEPSVWGLRLGAGVRAEDAFDRPGIGGATAQGFLFYRPQVVSGPRVVSEGHAVASYGPARLSVELASAWESRTRDTDGNPQTPREPLPTMQARGASVELSYVVLGQPRSADGWPREAPRAEGEPYGGGSVELAARFERVWLGLGAEDVQPGGAAGGAAAVRWWVNDFLAAGVAGYLLRYDQPPLEEPDRSLSWLCLARLTFRFR